MNREWVLVNYAERKIYPIDNKTTIGDHGSCQIKLWRTGLEVNIIRLLLTCPENELCLFVEELTNEITINDQRIDETFTQLFKGDTIQIFSYRYEVTRRLITQNETEQKVINETLIEDVKEKIAWNPRPLITPKIRVKPNQHPITITR